MTIFNKTYKPFSTVKAVILFVVFIILAYVAKSEVSAQEPIHICEGIPLVLTKSPTDNLITLSGESADIASYESNPASKNVIYLDFDGEYLAATHWSKGPINAVPASYFNDNERLLICKRVASDFEPFDVNITANKAVFDAAIKKQQVIFTSTKDWMTTPAGGIARIGTFNTGDVAWVFNQSVFTAAEGASHEIGHTLGLYHDGKGSAAYYYGHPGWAPIMGVSYYETMSQWSKGAYPSATMKQDDINIIAFQLPYKQDDYGSDLNNPSILQDKMTDAFGNFLGAGLISTAQDKDVFLFSVTGGSLNLNFGCDSTGDFTDLRIEASIYDASWKKIWSKNTTDLNVNSVIGLSAGVYYLVFDGVGYLTNTDGYSDYASLGKYKFSGNVSNNDPSLVDLAIVGIANQNQITCTQNITAGVTVKNTGNLTINNYDIIISDKNAVLTTVKISAPIKSGESVTHNIIVTPSFFMEWEYNAVLSNVIGDSQSANNMITSNQTKYYQGVDIEFKLPLDQRSALYSWFVFNKKGSLLLSNFVTEPNAISAPQETQTFCMPKDSCFIFTVNNPFREEWCSSELKAKYKTVAADYVWQIGDTVVGNLNGSEALYVLKEASWVGPIMAHRIPLQPEKFTLIECDVPSSVEFSFVNKETKEVLFLGSYEKGKNVYTKEICLPELITSALNIDKELETLIFPNPADQYFELKSNDLIDRIEIYNSIGQMVLQQTQSSLTNVSELNSGLYFIKIISGTKQSRQTLIISR